MPQTLKASVTLGAQQREKETSTRFVSLAAGGLENPSKLCNLVEDDIQKIILENDMELKKITKEISKLRNDSLAAARSARPSRITQIQDTPKQQQKALVSCENRAVSKCDKEKTSGLNKRVWGMNGRRVDRDNQKTKKSVLNKKVRKVDNRREDDSSTIS